VSMAGQARYSATKSRRIEIHRRSCSTTSEQRRTTRGGSSTSPMGGGGGTAGHWSQNVADPRENFVGHVVIYAVLGLAYNVAIQMIFVPHAMAAVVRYIYSNILSHGENVGIS